jgi:hypothetical protein
MVALRCLERQRTDHADCCVRPRLAASREFCFIIDGLLLRGELVSRRTRIALITPIGLRLPKEQRYRSLLRSHGRDGPPWGLRHACFPQDTAPSTKPTGTGKMEDDKPEFQPKVSPGKRSARVSGQTLMDPQTRAPGWNVRCLRCGFTEDWGKYGIRRGAFGRSYTVGWCPRFRWIRCHVIEKAKDSSEGQGANKQLDRSTPSSTR